MLAGILLLTTVTAGRSRLNMSPLKSLGGLILFLTSFSENVLSPLFLFFCLSLSFNSKSSEK